MTGSLWPDTWIVAAIMHATIAQPRLVNRENSPTAVYTEIVYSIRCLIACLLAALPASAALSIMPISDVRAGMHGIGKTVFSGDKIEDFDVEILGILENTGPKQSLILGRLSGGPLEHTGVMQGMSGSPVYIDGKLIGAVAMAFPYSKDPIAGIRPIEEMLRVATLPTAPPPLRLAGLTDPGLLLESSPETPPPPASAIRA